jgi:hypothetical protein
MFAAGLQRAPKWRRSAEVRRRGTTATLTSPGGPPHFPARAGQGFSSAARRAQPDRMNAVVVVESPAKAKTINKYLGKDYTVLASYGHVRDLPAKDGSVQPDDDFAMSWEVDAKASKRINDIAQAVRAPTG